MYYIKRSSNFGLFLCDVYGYRGIAESFFCGNYINWEGLNYYLKLEFVNLSVKYANSDFRGHLNYDVKMTHARLVKMRSYNGFLSLLNRIRNSVLVLTDIISFFFLQLLHKL